MTASERERLAAFSREIKRAVAASNEREAALLRTERLALKARIAAADKRRARDSARRTG